MAYPPSVPTTNNEGTAAVHDTAATAVSQDPDPLVVSPHAEEPPEVSGQPAANPGTSDTSSLISRLDVDSNEDSDSAFVSGDALSSTASLRSSIYDYVEENGRRYHRFKEVYLLPNDEVEQDRLDLQHHLFLLTLQGKLHLAPVEELVAKGALHNVLDIATGTGIWAIEFASIYPSANVLGTDLSPIQPEYIPANCRFEVDDAEDPWVYNTKFDYVHGRMLATCFSSHKKVFESAFHSLRPGGWIELQDGLFPFQCVDDSIQGTAFGRWLQLIGEGAAALGKDISRTVHYRRYLEELGFVDVVEKQLPWPIGTWARTTRMKTLGTWARENLLTGLQGFSMALLSRGLGMSAEAIELLLVDVRKDLNSKKLHCFIPMYFVYGRKPE